jgi:hypothetical protein
MATAYKLGAVQIGAESTWGTTVDQTAIVANVDECQLDTETTIARWGRLGDLAESVQRALTMTSGSASLSEKASYGQIGLWLQSLFGAATDAGAGPYTHTWEPDTTAAITPIFYTLLKSDGTNAASLAGAIVTELTLTFDPGEPVSAAVSFVGKNVQDDAITGSLSDFTDSTQIILPTELTVSLDPVGSAGSTNLDCDALSGSLTFRATTEIQHGLGAVAGCTYVRTTYETAASIVANASSSTFRTEVETHYGTAPTSTALDLHFNFSKSANYSLVVIMPCVMESTPTWHSERDGTSTFDASFVGVKSSSSSATNDFLDIVLTNQDAVI